MAVPVHAVLQRTLLPYIAARRARQIDIPGGAIEPPDDGSAEGLEKGLGRGRRVIRNEELLSRQRALE